MQATSAKQNVFPSRKGSDLLVKRPNLAYQLGGLPQVSPLSSHPSLALLFCKMGMKMPTHLSPLPKLRQ